MHTPFRFGPLLLLGGLLLTAHVASAQKYRTAIGARIGGGNTGITLQQRVWENTTIEGIGLIRPREVSVTALAERHFGILGPSLNYYFGAGGHLGRHKDYGAIGGFDGMIGAEYKVAFLPLLLSFDFKPTVEFNNEDWFRFPTAFSVRYVLIKEKKKPSAFEGLFGGDKDKQKSKKKSKSESNSRWF
jgi:hypothetical protein